jgi:hypothetical protein
VASKRIDHGHKSVKGPGLVVANTSQNRIFDRSIAVVLFFALPLSLAPGVLFFFDVTPKACLLLAGAAMGMISLALRPPDAERLWREKTFRWFILLLLLYLLVLAVATLHSSVPSLSLFGSDWRRFGLIEQVALACLGVWLWVRCREDAGFGRFCLKTVCVAGIVASLYAIVQSVGFDPFLDREAYRLRVGPAFIFRPPSTFGHAIYLANFCLYAISCAVAIALTARNAGERLIACVAIPLTLAAIYVSGTRAVVGGAIVGILLACAIAWPKRRRLLLVSALGMPLVLGVLFWLPANYGYRSRLFHDIGGSRSFLWRDSTRLALSTGISGIGPEIFARELPKWRGDDFARTFPDSYDESPHNMFLDAWVATGFPGLLMTGVLVLAAAFASARSAIADPRYIAPLFGGLLGAVVSQQFSCFVIVTALCFLTILVVAVSAGATPQRREPPGPVRRAVCGFGGLALFGILAWGAFALFAADFDRGKLLSLIDQKRYRESIGTYEAGSKRQVVATSADLWFARHMNDLFARTQDPSLKAAAYRASVEAAASAARDGDPPALAAYEAATLAGAAGDPAGTERDLEAALKWSPNWYRAHWALAEIFAAEGRTAQSSAHAAAALSYLDPSEERLAGIAARLKTLAAADHSQR